MFRPNRYIRLTKDERDRKYSNLWPTMKPIKDADVWKIILNNKKEEK